MKLFGINREHLTDDELLNRYQHKGDTESLGLLYDRYLHLVYGLCLKYLKDRELSQDAVMDIYELLTDKLTTHQVTHFKSWLYMVSKNHCLMQLRKSGRQQNIDEVFMESDQTIHLNDEPSLEANLSALEDCIETLKNDQKACVKAFYLEEKSYQEISQGYKLEVKTVKSHIQNGKRNLKICMESKHVEG